ncbi:MAG: electron transport protein SCO1/SenC [Rhodobacterales bacterium 65-51]|mgnify:CR=1 FL=1|uniref:SCO family protein n=1 Tax=uncultured Gemmobacter sp. TaxID=1095917 RepID=UPI000961DBE5|nr:SCO family protein [uncultured Gemmobacter sp.]OJY28870.1 MAG: electron transport protein SCO1/SenC [Rhodobacterales bacterium 65-51]
MRLTKLQSGLWGAVVLALLGVAALRLLDQGAPVTDQAAFRPEFALADADGQTRTNAEFAGKHLLVFFGFTNCPDVCPTTLSEVAQVMDDLGEDASRVQPIFISVDPERDRRLGIAAFTQAFHPSILGLAGDDVATRAAADSFKIFYERESDPNAPDGYTMSHSPALYLVGPEGDWLRQFSYGTPASEILADLQSRL